MNKIKSNIIPVFVAVLILTACGLSWFLFHPASPYHRRYSFVVSFQAVGTLSPGNLVRVRGIPKGEITKVELTDDAVLVSARVLADAKIPKNSEFRLINSGLMGEREMFILTGDSPNLVADGDTLVGLFDEGTSGVSAALSEALADLDSIKHQLTDLLDSLMNGSMGKQAVRVINKGKNILGKSDEVVVSAKDEAIGILDKLDGSLEKAKGVLESVTSQGQETVEKVDVLVGRVDGLLEQVKDMKTELDSLAEKLDKDDNSVGLILADNGRFAKELQRMSKDVDALLTSIKKGGLKLNVDIF